MDSKYFFQSLEIKSRIGNFFERSFSRFQKTTLYDKVCLIGAKCADLTMTDFKEFLQLLWLNLVVLKRNFVEYVKVVFKYYSNLSFAKVDTSILLMYFFHNPFKISKRFLLQKGEKDVYAYGETPLTSLDLIAKECRIKKEDIVFELGAGRGRGCFWLNRFIGCQVVGIEYIPDFVERIERIKRKCPFPDVQFRNEDMLKSDFSGGTVFYLYGTSYEDDFILKLVEKFKKLPFGTKIITVSYPLKDYTDQPIFEVMKRFPVRFTWGTADVYLQILKG